MDENNEMQDRMPQNPEQSAGQEQEELSLDAFSTEEDEPTLDAVDTSDLEANLHLSGEQETAQTDITINANNNKEEMPAENAGESPAGPQAGAPDAEPAQQGGQNAIDWMFDDTMSYFNSMVTGVSYYPELLSVMQGGRAQISLHRRYMLKAIDEKWVNIVEDSLPSLDVCIRNPRHYIEEIEEILPIELSRNISPRSVKHLAQHTDYISQIQGDEITPSKILNVFREDTIQTYENKFVNTLILRLFIFVNRRYEIALREGSDEKDTMLDFTNEFEHGETKGKVSVHLELDEKPTPGEVVKNYTYTTEVWKRVEKLNNIILTYMNSKFVEDMGKSYIRPPVMRTNALMKNKDLHQLLVLWEFINSYEGAGYSMLVQDDLENVDAKYQGALYATTAMQYLVFRDSVERGFANNETLDSRLTDKPVMPEIVDKLPEEPEKPTVNAPEDAPAEKATKQTKKGAPRSLRDTGTDPSKYRPKKLNAFERTVSLALEIALQTADQMEELNPYVPPKDPEELAEEAAAAAAAAEAEAAAKAEAEAAAKAQAEAEAEAETAQNEDDAAAVPETTDENPEPAENTEDAASDEPAENAETAETAETAENAENTENTEPVDADDMTPAENTADAEPAAQQETAETAETAESVEDIPAEITEPDDVREQEAPEAPETAASTELDRNEGLGEADFTRDRKPAREVPDMSEAGMAADLPGIVWTEPVGNVGNVGNGENADNGDNADDAGNTDNGNENGNEEKQAFVTDENTEHTTDGGQTDEKPVVTADSLIDHSIEVPEAKVDPSFKATIHWSGDEKAPNADTEKKKRKVSLFGWLRRKDKKQAAQTDEVNRRE